VCVHGEIAIGNLLVKDGKLKAVIDFGQLANMTLDGLESAVKTAVS